MAPYRSLWASLTLAALFWNAIVAGKTHHPAEDEHYVSVDGRVLCDGTSDGLACATCQDCLVEAVGLLDDHGRSPVFTLAAGIVASGDVIVGSSDAAKHCSDLNCGALVPLKLQRRYAARHFSADVGRDEGRRVRGLLPPTSRRLAYPTAYGPWLPSRWVDGVLPVDMEALEQHMSYAQYPQLYAYFMEAIYHYALLTPVRIVPKESHHVDYLAIEMRLDQAGVCWSSIGRTGGRQTITVQDAFDCDGASWIHELGHTLGLEHEHQRPDRDAYVFADESKITAAWAPQYDMWPTFCSDGDDYYAYYPADFCVDSLSSPYDYRSIMHYHDDPTIEGWLIPLEQPYAQYNAAYPDAPTAWSSPLSNDFGLTSIDSSHLTVIYGSRCLDDPVQVDGCESLDVQFSLHDTYDGTYALSTTTPELNGYAHWVRQAGTPLHIYRTSTSKRWFLGPDTQSSNKLAYLRVTTPRPPSSDIHLAWTVWDGGAVSWREDDDVSIDCVAQVSVAWVAGPWGACRESPIGATRERVVWCRDEFGYCADAGQCDSENQPESVEECSLSTGTEACDFETYCPWLHPKVVPELLQWEVTDGTLASVWPSSHPPPTDSASNTNGRFMIAWLDHGEPHPANYGSVMVTEPFDISSGDVVLCVDFWLNGDSTWWTKTTESGTDVFPNVPPLVVSVDNGGGNPVVAATIASPSFSWRSTAIALPALAGASRVRFELRSNGNNMGTGAVDNVTVVASAAACSAPQWPAATLLQPDAVGSTGGDESSGDDPTDTFSAAAHDAVGVVACCVALIATAAIISLLA